MAHGGSSGPRLRADSPGLCGQRCSDGPGADGLSVCVRVRVRVCTAALAGWPGRSPESGSGGYDELENFPNKVEIFTASVEGKLSDPSYIMKCAARPRSFARPLAQEVR
eukprot:COSAG02_NODE_650_length_18912_cov_23.728698_9_plen_109_part_00